MSNINREYLSLKCIIYYREVKQTDANLDTLERRIDTESRRLDRGAHPTEAKMAAEQIESALRSTDATIQDLFQDVQQLREGRYSQTHDLHTRYEFFIYYNDNK